jgi:thiamine biosynthesis lipoprotein
MTRTVEAHRFAHHAMGTFFEAVIASNDPTYAGQAARAAFKEIDRLEGLFSRFDIRSEIARLNRLQPGQSMAIGVETFDCLTMAEEIREETGGAFDVNRRAWENRDDQDEPGEANYPPESEPAPAAFSLLETAGGYEFKRLVGGDGPLYLDLDLGAIGKGFALDSALEVLADWDIENVLLHGGTSTALASGTAPGRKEDETGWPVGVGGGWPCLGVPNEIVLQDNALSGSGTEVKGEHILDPRTGKPARGHLAAWAIHDVAAVSDAVSTAFMVMTTAQVEVFCAAHPDVWALAVIDYGKCRAFNPDAI